MLYFEKSIAIDTKKKVMRMLWKDILVSTIWSNVSKSSISLLFTLEGIEYINRLDSFHYLCNKYREKLINDKFNNITMVKFD